MNIKNNRITSFILLLLIYTVASLIGIIVYQKLTLDFWLKLLIADTIATIIIFIFSLIFNNASVYDPYWSVQPIIILGALAIKKGISITCALPLLAIFIWGIRLTINWGYTFQSLNHQDWRYTMLKEKSKKLYPLINFTGIHLVPTIIVYLCILPVVYLFYNNVPFEPIAIIFIIISLIAIILQGVADYEMHSFRLKKTGELIREGLWTYSRHPNYLGEILMWWGIGLYCATTANNYLLIIGAIGNTLLFLFISIPLAENHLATRKPGYEKYKKETRMLLPIKKKIKEEIC